MLRQGTLSHLATGALGLDVAQALGVMIRGDRRLPLSCARLDLVAKDGVLQTRRALLDNADTVLKDLGLWLEHPAATKGWAHVQTKPPRSGRRVFYP